MLAIRMRRAGSKNRPFFRVVVTETRSARDGRFVEMLGHYNPRTKPETLVLDQDRVAHWLKSGATPSAGALMALLFSDFQESTRTGPKPSPPCPTTLTGRTRPANNPGGCCGRRRPTAGG